MTDETRPIIERMSHRDHKHYKYLLWAHRDLILLSGITTDDILSGFIDYYFSLEYPTNFREPMYKNSYSQFYNGVSNAATDAKQRDEHLLHQIHDT